MVIDNITLAEKIIGITVTAGGVFWAMWVNVISPILSNISAKRQDDQDKFDQMFHLLIGSNGSSVKSRLERIESRQILGEQTSKALMHSLKVGYWKSDKEGRCIDSSRTLCSIIGRSEDEIHGNNWSAWLHPDCKDRIYAAWEFAVKHGTEFNEEYSFVRPDKVVVRVRGVAYQLYDDHDNLIGFFGTLSKVSETV